MREKEIIGKLKQDIKEKERSYKQELEKIKKEDNLLNYIRGMLEITKDNVSNFPYYDGTDDTQDDSEEDFNVMLKYTLKEDKIIASFKAEIKNLYYLEKIGYQHAEQYEDTKRKLMEYRQKIKDAYEELIANETLKKAIAKKETILTKLDTLKETLEEEAKETEKIDDFYESLQYANLSESEKTKVLISIFEKNTALEQEYLKELEQAEKEIKKSYPVSSKELEKIKRKIKEGKLETIGKIKITYPKKEEIVKAELKDLATKEQDQRKTEIKDQEKKSRFSIEML